MHTQREVFRDRNKKFLQTIKHAVSPQMSFANCNYSFEDAKSDKNFLKLFEIVFKIIAQIFLSPDFLIKSFHERHRRIFAKYFEHMIHSDDF